MLLKVQPIDALAVAITVGEAGWQFAMVIVNRNYSSYCVGGGTLQSSARTGLAILGYMVAAGLFAIVVPMPFSIPRFDWPLIGWGVVFFAAMAALSELRSFFWARGLYDRQIIAAQIIIVVVQALVVVLAPARLWLPLTASLMVVASLAVLTLALRARIKN